MCINQRDCDGHSVLKMAIIFVLAVGFVIADAVLQSIVEQGKREQARYNLEQVKYCYNRTFERVGTETALGICTNKSKTSFTGDVYAMTVVYEHSGSKVYKFIHENSKDTGPIEDMLFTKESVGKYFKDWESGAKALEVIALGKDSEKGVNVSYNFDGDIEWLEWKFIPDETDVSPIVVVQGTQRDEVMAKYTVYRITGFVGVSLVVLSLLIANSNAIRRRNAGRDC